MVETPETRYASVGDAQVAYQVVGEGPTDLLYCYGLGGHVDAFWELGDIRRLFGALGSFSRVILFDRRGTGVSDALPAGAFPTWEELAEDQAAVLEAVGSERTALLANLDSGPMAILFAAMHPEAVTALVLVNTSARYSQADDYPIGEPAEAVDALVDVLESTWGTPELAALSNPDRADDPEYLRIAARLLRASATPRAAASQYRYMLRNLDVREALGLVQAPTLVLHSQTSPFIPLAHGRYLAEHIAGARLVEVPGGNLAYMTDDTIAVITDFLTGDIADLDIDRLLTTVLFTDIVDSTSRASSMGDHRWRALLDAHDEAVRELLRRFRGREVNTTGDGFVASFDGPARAIRCARAIRSATTRLGLQLRVGMHTGECEVRGDDLGGLAVHIAARVAKLAGPDHILVSRTVVDLVAGSGIEFDDRGEHELKGVPGLWRLHSVKS